MYDLIGCSEPSVHRYPGSAWEDRSTWKQTQAVDQLGYCAAGFEGEFESRAAEALSV
ncbi:MAG TPA: hypothetical protein VK575_07345 [Gemmatimonadaceae bacterium]|nr:hypothetical protein [Gemmatimonadaceae bacterium]